MKPLSGIRLFSPSARLGVKRTFSTFPKLPLIEKIIHVAASSDHFKRKFEKTAFVGVQHILESTASLFDGLIRLGVHPNNMYFSDKPYSTCQDIAEIVKKMGIHLIQDDHRGFKVGEYRSANREKMKYLWKYAAEDLRKKDIHQIIILDEGGRCLENMERTLRFNPKYRIAGIEQTRGGLYSPALQNLTFPLINVAQSAIKQKIESGLIAEAILSRVEKTMSQWNVQKNSVCGVIGNGAIGLAVARYLLKSGFTVVVYDSNEWAFRGESGCYRLNSVKSVIDNSEYIFGCTGSDITEGIDFSNFTTPKVFISCSSEDREFKSLLNLVPDKSQNPLNDVLFSTSEGNKITILNGGFPINFDRSPISVSSDKIQLTRGVLLGACLQATHLSTSPIQDGTTINKGYQVALNPYLQQFILKTWMEDESMKSLVLQDDIHHFENIAWISKNSMGESREDSDLTALFDQSRTEEKKETEETKENSAQFNIFSK